MDRYQLNQRLHTLNVNSSDMTIEQKRNYMSRVLTSASNQTGNEDIVDNFIDENIDKDNNNLLLG